MFGKKAKDVKVLLFCIIWKIKFIHDQTHMLTFESDLFTFMEQKLKDVFCVISPKPEQWVSGSSSIIHSRLSLAGRGVGGLNDKNVSSIYNIK